MLPWRYGGGVGGGLTLVSEVERRDGHDAVPQPRQRHLRRFRRRHQIDSPTAWDLGASDFALKDV